MKLIFIYKGILINGEFYIKNKNKRKNYKNSKKLIAYHLISNFRRGNCFLFKIFQCSRVA